MATPIRQLTHHSPKMRRSNRLMVLNSFNSTQALTANTLKKAQEPHCTKRSTKGRSSDSLTPMEVGRLSLIAMPHKLHSRKRSLARLSSGGRCRLLAHCGQTDRSRVCRLLDNNGQRATQARPQFDATLSRAREVNIVAVLGNQWHHRPTVKRSIS